MEKICYNCFAETLNEAGVCTRCGYDGAKNQEKFPQALPQGSILYGRYIIGRVLGQGGFGITYLAQDYQTKELVAIKEFFPDTMATRTGGTTVTPFSGERGENFAYGRDTFLEEAKTMAEFLDNPNIVRVHSYFEENGTGYFVMEYLDGVSFQQYIKDHGGRISWAETLEIMLPILDVLSAMHAKGIIHRDVTPDNIFITKDGTVKLLDFGAARYSLGNVSRSLDVILKHGFAPKEQYKRHGRQGPYTDVYSTAATIYYAVTGTKPDDAIERSDEDTMPLPTTLGAKITEAQEKVLLKGLAVQAENRYQTMDDFRDALIGAVQPEPVNKTTPKPVVKDDQKEQKTAGRKSLPKWLIPACAAAVLVFVALQIGMSMGRSSKDSPVVQSPPLKTYVMMATSEESLLEIDDEDRENQPFWGQETYLRKDVKAVRFETGLEDAPSNAWDVSQAGDKSILAWMEDGVLHVASEGIIALNPDSAMCFYYFSNLKEIDFGTGVDTSQVTDMRYMFWDCRSLTSLDLSGFDTSKVTDMFYMFCGCNSLTNLDVRGFDTSQVTNMGGMFWNCRSLTSLDLSGFDTSQVTSMWWMFCGCSSLTSLDLSGFDTSQATSKMSMLGLFFGCDSLKNLTCSDSQIRSAYESAMNSNEIVNQVLEGRAQEQETSLGTGTQETVMPPETRQTEPRQTEPRQTEDVQTPQSTLPPSAKSALQRTMDVIRGVKDDSWKDNVMISDVFYDTSKRGRVLGSQFYRDEIRSVTFLDTLDDAPDDAWCVSEGNDGSAMAWIEENQDLYDLYIAGDGGVSAPENACGLFAGYKQMENIHFNGNFHTENTTQMQYMFYACFALKKLDVSDFDTSKVTRMECMFCWCKELEALDLQNFDTSQVVDMGSMFMHCENITYLNLESFVLKEDVNTAYMFADCPADATVIKGW